MAKSFCCFSVVGPPMELVRTGNFDEDARTNARRLLKLFEFKLRSDPGQWAVLESIWDAKKQDEKQREPAGTLQ